MSDDGFIETYRGIVYPWDCDAMGHVNVAVYTRIFDEANWHLHSGLGMTRADIERTGHGFVAVENRVVYKRELGAGALLRVVSTVVEVREKVLRVLHRLRHAEEGYLAAENEGVTCAFDMSARRAMPWPDTVRQAAERQRALTAPG